VPECGCGPPDDLISYNYVGQQQYGSRKRSTAALEAEQQQFIWAGCSDGITSD
jgi:hypothetical protein